MTATAVITQRDAPITGEIQTRPNVAPPTAMRQAAAPDQPVAARPTRSRVSRQSSTVVALVGATALVGAAVLGIGWKWRDLKPASRKLRYKIEDIRIPIALPVTIGEVGWRLFLDSRAANRPHADGSAGSALEG